MRTISSHHLTTCTVLTISVALDDYSYANKKTDGDTDINRKQTYGSHGAMHHKQKKHYPSHD